MKRWWRLTFVQLIQYLRTLAQLITYEEEEEEGLHGVGSESIKILRTTVSIHLKRGTVDPDMHYSEGSGTYILAGVLLEEEEAVDECIHVKGVFVPHLDLRHNHQRCNFYTSPAKPRELGW